MSTSPSERIIADLSFTHSDETRVRTYDGPSFEPDNLPFGAKIAVQLEVKKLLREIAGLDSGNWNSGVWALSADIGKYVGDGLYVYEAAAEEILEAARTSGLHPGQMPDDDSTIISVIERGLNHGINQGLSDYLLDQLGLLPDPEPVVVEKVEEASSGKFGYQTSNGRTTILTPMSAIKTKRAKWVWKDRISLGTLALLAGQPSMGKSQVACWLAARLTQGELYGEFFGTPKDVIICATEDSFEFTIKPRLQAAGADPNRVFRIDIQNRDDVTEGLNLVNDREGLRAATQDLDVALLILDPLMSRLGTKLDSHKDADVRTALEPLVALANECGFAVLGLMHFNKGGRTNPLDALMGSVAFGAVARSVHICIKDSGNPSGRLFGTEKNNLGKVSGSSPHDLDTWMYHIEGVSLMSEDEVPEPIETSRIEWDGDSNSTVTDSLIAQSKGNGQGSAPKASKYDEAHDWLYNLFNSRGPLEKSKVMDIAHNDKMSSHSDATIRRVIKDEDEFDTKQTSSNGKRVALWGLTEQIEAMDD